jgi:hypothetical protein
MNKFSLEIKVGSKWVLVKDFSKFGTAEVYAQTHRLVEWRIYNRTINRIEFVGNPYNVSPTKPWEANTRKEFLPKDLVSKDYRELRSFQERNPRISPKFNFTQKPARHFLPIDAPKPRPKPKPEPPVNWQKEGF